MKSFTLFLGLLLFFLFLNVLDGHSTFLVVKQSNLNSERNPIARAFFKKFGLINGIYALKSIIIFLIPFMFWVHKEAPFDMNIVLIFANVAYSLVVSNNYRLFIKIRKIKGDEFASIQILKRGFFGKNKLD